MAGDTGEATLAGPAGPQEHGPDASAAVRVRNLTVSFPTPDGPLPAVAGVSLDLSLIHI